MIMKEVDPNKLIPHESTKKAYMAIIPNHRKPLSWQHPQDSEGLFRRRISQRVAYIYLKFCNSYDMWAHVGSGVSVASVIGCAMWWWETVLNLKAKTLFLGAKVHHPSQTLSEFACSCGFLTLLSGSVATGISSGIKFSYPRPAAAQFITGDLPQPDSSPRRVRPLRWYSLWVRAAVATANCRLAAPAPSPTYIFCCAVTAIPIYLLVALKVPKWFKAIEKIRSFVWKGRKEVNGGYCFARVCISPQEGLGKGHATTWARWSRYP
jgi:hypothetical protein